MIPIKKIINIYNDNRNGFRYGIDNLEQDIK